MIIVPDTLPAVNRAIIAGAQRAFPILEIPPGSNRSPEIDRMCRRWGVPLASAWCALWTTDVWCDAGADIPPIDRAKDWHPAKAETWRRWAVHEGLFSVTPVLGAAALYGIGGQPPASHIGCCVVALVPFVYNLEGNTSETGYSREGTLTELKRVNTERLIGYVVPRLRR